MSTQLIEAPCPMVDRAEIAKALGVIPNTVTAWARDGVIPPPLKLHRTHRWPRAVLDDLLAGRTPHVVATPAPRTERAGASA